MRLLLFGTTPAKLFPIALTAVLAVSFSCRQEPKSQTKSASTFTVEQTETVTRIGSEASQALMKNLGGQLKAALQSGGPEKALHVCQQIAQPLTTSTSQELPAATVTRTALRYRNPINAPDARDQEVLSRWQGLLTEGKNLPENEIVLLDKDQALFYKPILTEAICLKCHGDPATFSPALAKKINEAYPKDQAIGFQEGDLRGAFRVQVTLKTPK